MTDTDSKQSGNHGVELILMQQLAGYLAMPIFIVDPDGDLLFYNEPAEAILGHRFEETGAMAMETWSSTFEPEDEDGTRLPAEELPLVRALSQGQAAHRAFWIRGLDGRRRHIAVTAFPLIGQSDRNLGAVAMFWEAPSS